MTHSFTLVSADTQILFECTVCSQQIMFARPGDGEPHAVPDGDSWLPPEDAADYLAPCLPPVDHGPEPVPDVITKRLFLIQLLRSGTVTAQEVPTLAMQPPASVSSLFAGLSTEVQAEVQLTWAAMTEVHRHDPLLDMAVAGNLMTNEDLDNFFRAAALI